jgi:hypothetical protein
MSTDDGQPRQPPRRKVTELLDVDAPPPSHAGDESEHELVARVRHLYVRRPVLKAVVAAALLAPAAGQDVLNDGDRPFVLLLCTMVTWLLLFAFVRLHGDRGPQLENKQVVVRLMGGIYALSVAGFVCALVAVFVRTTGTAQAALLLQWFATLGAVVLVHWISPGHKDKGHDPHAPIAQPSGYDAFTQAVKRADVQTPENAEQTPEKAFQGTAIACSGGGIRSAAFCLGGMQRLRDCDEEGASLYDRADRVYAVSGGGYIATALHMARKHSDASPEVQKSIFAPGSPEEDWLRRRSKFLLPSGSTMINGVLSLLYGIAVNVTLIGVALYWVALYIGWVHQRITVICPDRGLLGAATCLGDGSQADFDSGRGAHGGWFVYGWGLLVAGLLLFVVTKVIAKYRGRGRLVLASVTQTLVGIGLAVGALVIVLPWLVVVLNNATLENRPTQTVARVMAASRLATPDGCLLAIENDFTVQAELAWGRATTKQRADSVPFTYGGCGGSWTDDAVVFAPGGTVDLGPADTWCDVNQHQHPVPSFCDDRPGPTGSSLTDTLVSWLTAVIALAAAVRSLLKAGQASAPQTRRGALLDVFRRLVVPWLAGAIVLGAAFVVLLVLVRDNLLYPQRLDAYRVELVAILVVVAIRLLSDAMLSSLHPFYRERLSDVFLVHRKDHTAEPLDYKTPTHVFVNGFANLPDDAVKGPNLVVCCSVNISDRDYIPAARGCAPFQFRTGPNELDDELVPNGLIGISDARLPRGRMQPAQAYSATSDPQGLDTTVAAAMAASAAAFSPVVGRMSGRTRPYRMLLALANARLGVWLPNPYMVNPSAIVQEEPVDWRDRGIWAWRRMTRPGPLRIFREAFGSMTIDDTRVYITDGGHYDNTAMVEALRDRPRTLFVLDASADAEDSLDALSDAIVTARMDLGLVVRPSPPTAAGLLRRDAAASVNVIPRGAQTAVSLPQRASQGWMHLTVSTVRDPETVVSDVWFVKNVRTSEPNLEIDGYAADNPAFPVTSTGNQFYGEYDFEAYRLLGYTNTTKMLDAYYQANPAQQSPAPPTRKPV